MYWTSPSWGVHIDVIDGFPVVAPITPCAVLLLCNKTILPHWPSGMEDDPPQDAVAVEHAGDAILEDDGDRLARVSAPDGAPVAAKLEITAPIKAADADPPRGRRGEVDAPGAQERDVAPMGPDFSAVPALMGALLGLVYRVYR